MSKFLLITSETQTLDPSAGIDAVRSFFQANAFNGLVEFQSSADTSLLILFAEGVQIGAYFLDNFNALSLSPEQAPDYFPRSVVPMRSVRCSRVALRTIFHAMEWYPAKHTFTAQIGALKQYLDENRTWQTSGLLHIMWPEAEGFLMLADGTTLDQETIYAAQNGISAGPAALRQVLSQLYTPCTVALYAALPQSKAYQILLLRSALSGLLKDAISRYQQLVGRSLANSMIGSINNLMRSQKYSIDCTLDGMSDTQIFTTLEEAIRAYDLLIKTTLTSMSKVVGHSLAFTIIADAFKRLDQTGQKAIQSHSMLLAISAGR